MRPLPLRGEIEAGAAIELLRDLEARCITGTLRFAAIDHDDAGEIELYGGEIAAEQASIGARDPVDVFLEAGALSYEIAPRLPPLPVSKGDAHRVRGSLRVHVPADLMAYCEGAGLTGVLELSHGKQHLEAVYENGELLAIALDGKDASDLQEVFGWDEGEFRIEIDTEAPTRLRSQTEPSLPIQPPTAQPEAPAKPREHTQQFLRVVEMALADVLVQSERARSPTRTSPPLPPAPTARPRRSKPPKRRSDEQTVQLIYLGGEAPEVEPDESTRHVSSGVVAEPSLPKARPERRGKDEAVRIVETAEEPPPARVAPLPLPAAAPPLELEAAPVRDPVVRKPAKSPAPPKPASSPLGAIAWILVFLVVFLSIVAVMARVLPAG